MFPVDKSSSTFSSRLRVAKAPLIFLLSVAVLEVVVGSAILPVHLVDIRIEQAESLRGDRRDLVLGDSVANQIAPPANYRVRRWLQAASMVGPLPDKRREAARSLDERAVFLTSNAAVTVLGFLLLYRKARASGARPDRVHVLTTWSTWGYDHENPYFFDSFAHRFTSPGDIWTTYDYARDPKIAARMALHGILPSAKTRSVFAGRLTAKLTPRRGPKPPRPSGPAAEAPVAWNLRAFSELVAETERDGLSLIVHVAPHRNAGAGDSWRSWWKRWNASIEPLRGRRTVLRERPPGWPASWFRDGIHLNAEHVPALAGWFRQRLSRVDTSRP